MVCCSMYRPLFCSSCLDIREKLESLRSLLILPQQNYINHEIGNGTFRETEIKEM